MALTAFDAKRKYEARFPDKKLLEFNGTAFPCTILCPIHGEQRVSRFSNILNSVTGCPECGLDQRKKLSGDRMRKAYAAATAASVVPLMLPAAGAGVLVGGILSTQLASVVASLVALDDADEAVTYKDYENLKSLASQLVQLVDELPVIEPNSEDK